MAIVSAIVSAVVGLVISTGIALIQRAFKKRRKDRTQSLDFEQVINRRVQNGAPVEVVIGRRITGGVGTMDDGAPAPKNENGIQVSVISVKPCTSFHTLFLDGEPMTLSGNPTQGEVLVTSHFLGKNSVSRVKFRIFLGDDNSALGAYLASKLPSRYTAADNHGECCVIVTDCRNTDDDFDEDEGKNYIPFQNYPDVKVEVSGVKICDPRNGGVYGDESTYVYNNLAALADAQVDFGFYTGSPGNVGLVVGNGYPVELMNLTQIIANANYCQTEGFTCNGVLQSGNAADQVEIQKCYNAVRVESPASVYCVPEGNRTQFGDIDFSLFPAARIKSYNSTGFSTESFNEVHTEYAEPEERYAKKEMPTYFVGTAAQEANYIPRPFQLPLLFVTNSPQAAKLQKQEADQFEAQEMLEVVNLPLRFRRIRVGELVRLRNTDLDRVNDRWWIVEGLSRSARGDVSLSLKSFSAMTFNPDTDIPEIEINTPLPISWEDWYERPDITQPDVVEVRNYINDNRGQLDNILLPVSIDAVRDTVSLPAYVGDGAKFINAIDNLRANLEQRELRSAELGNYDFGDRSTGWDFVGDGVEFVPGTNYDTSQVSDETVAAGDGVKILLDFYNELKGIE